MTFMKTALKRAVRKAGLLKKILFFALIATAQGTLAGQADSTAEKPNIVFFLVDDFGKGALSSMGSDLHETPNIDRLAESGMRFTDGYAACTVCSPSRAAILTGRYPGRSNLTDWIAGHFEKYKYEKLKVPDWKMYMEHEWELLPEALKEAGYATGFFGKWHLMPKLDKKRMKKHYPTDHGFDINIGGREWGQPSGRGKYFHPFDMPNMESEEGDFLTDRLTDYAVDFIDNNKNKPFFLYMSYYTVHTPLMGKPELVEKYEQKIAGGTYDLSDLTPHWAAHYAAMVESLDISVGRILDQLEAHGLGENTIVVFTGDNGAVWNDYTGGLRGHKALSHEGGVREPVVISWPGKIEAGSVCDVPMIGTDFYPTLLDLTGLPLRKDQHMDGVTLKPLLLQTGDIPERSLFWHYPHYHRTTPYGAIRKGKWKLIEFFEDGRLELYNLEKDQAETTNLADKKPEKAKALLTELKAWRATVKAQMPSLNPETLLGEYTFDGTGDLDGKTATVDSGITDAGGSDTWTAHKSINADGSLDGAASGSAYIDLGSYIEDAKGTATGVFELTVDVSVPDTGWLSVGFGDSSAKRTDWAYGGSGGFLTTRMGPEGWDRDITSMLYENNETQIRSYDTTGPRTLTITLDYSTWDGVNDHGSVTFDHGEGGSSGTVALDPTDGARDIQYILLSKHGDTAGTVFNNLTLTQITQPLDAPDLSPEQERTVSDK